MAHLPILYSFRRCPYAIRARLAIKVSHIQVELREVILADKPQEMLHHSPKGTVPVLVLADGSVIDESRDIMLWALQQNDPEQWLSASFQINEEINYLIKFNDGEFKQQLDHYKYADHYPEFSLEDYRQRAEVFLLQLEERLNQHRFLTSDKVSLADMALFPFIRQFAYVDKDWFDNSSYIKLQQWLDALLVSELFNDVMKKQVQWHAGSEVQLF